MLFYDHNTLCYFIITMKGICCFTLQSQYVVLLYNHNDYTFSMFFSFTISIIYPFWTDLNLYLVSNPATIEIEHFISSILRGRSSVRRSVVRR